MPYYATSTPGAVTPNTPNSPNTADNSPALPNTPNSANDYVPQLSQENTPGAPATPGTPNTPNAPNPYQAPDLPSPAVPNLPNTPNNPNAPNEPNSSLSQGNVPASANLPNAPNTPNKPNGANIPSLSQGSVSGQENQELTTKSGTIRHKESAVPQSLTPQISQKSGSGGVLWIVFGAVLLLTMAGFLAWKRKKKQLSGPKDQSISDQHSPETPPREP